MAAVDNSNAHQNDDNPKYPTITRAELAGGYFNKHVAFVIRTTSGSIIKRRYTDFEWLRYLLCTLYPGAFIPPIPPKLPVAMWPQGYLLMRKRELQQFLQRLEVIPYLKAEEATNFFLTNHGGVTFDKTRKKWEKEHPKPSDKALFDKMIETFPKIHQTATPSDMDKRCRESTELIDSSIKQLDIMVKSSEAFIESTKECCDAMSDFRNCFDELIRIEYEGIEIENTNCCDTKRVDVSPYIEQWKTYKMDEINNMNIYYVPTLNRALNDLRVIKEILNVRDKLKSDYSDAKKRADVWNKSDGKLVRSSDLAKKHREVQREEDLRNLKGFVEKLVLGQLNVVFCANTRRWKKSCGLFASKHLMALEKVLGAWKDLANKILKERGNTDGIFKAVMLETIEDEEKEEKKEDIEDEDEHEQKGDDDEDEDEEDQERLRKEREKEEEERLEREREKEEEERLKREREKMKAEEERKRKEEEERERVKKAEELNEQKKETQKKMDTMFKDEADNEFPWDDEQ